MLRLAGNWSNGTPFVILGLDKRNLGLMREGQPIRLNLRNLDPDGPPVEELPDLELVLVFAGTDEVSKLMAIIQEHEEREEG